MFANIKSKWGFQPSCDGEWLAWWGIRFGRTVLFIGKLGPSGKLEIVTPLNGKVQDFFWTAFQPTLNLMVENRLWRLDPSKPHRANWTDITPCGFQHWHIIAEPRRPAGLRVVASIDRNPDAPDLYTTSLDGSDKTLLEQNDGSVLTWILDQNNIPVVRIDRPEGKHSAYFYRTSRSDDWREFARVSIEDTFIVGTTSTPGKFQALSNCGRDKTVLMAVDPATGSENVLLESDMVDITEIHQFSAGSIVDLAVIHDGLPSYVGLTERGKGFASLLATLGDKIHAESLEFSGTGRYATVGVSVEGRPYDTYFFDIEASRVERVAKNPLNKPGRSFAKTMPVTLPARDGLAIPGLLTVPAGPRTENLPAVVLVHGGPADRDYYKYDRDKQFLSSRGYTVLSVNFRGSTGYGKLFQSAGYRAFGRAIQNDLVDAAKWLIGQGLAKPNAIGVMGASFGGYAAAFAMTQEPAIFRAAVAENAITDLKYQMENIPLAWKPQLDRIECYFGNPTVPEDVTVLADRSPITHATQVRGSVLITAGKLDPIINFEQSVAFEKALRANNVDVAAVYFAKEGHGYSRWQTRATRARAIEKFFARTLGGRQERSSLFASIVRHLFL